MNMKVTSSVSALPPLMEWLGSFAIVGVLWYGSREIASGALTEGEFTLFVGAMLLMYAPIKRLSRVNGQHPAGPCGVRAGVRDARHAQRGGR